MKKTTILAFCLGLLAFTACGDKKAPQAAQAPAAQEQTAITDSAFQAAMAGEYKSYDGKEVITLNSDFSASVKNYNKAYYKWEFMVQPEGNDANILISRKGVDTDIQDQALVDLAEGSITIKNETFRKTKEAKEEKK